MKRISLSSRLCAVAVMSLLATACDREKRDFHVATPAVKVSENVHAFNGIRPGPKTPPVASTSQPVNLYLTTREPFRKSFVNNAQAQSDGQTLYESFNCVGCHAHGGGGMAPPLIDNKWFYGDQPEEVYMSIMQGRPNGMPAFRGRIPDYQIWALVAYVRSLSGHANPNAASGREDHMATQPPPNSMKPETPQVIPQPATMPAWGQTTTAPTTTQPATTQSK